MRKYNIDKMITYLRGFFQGADMLESMKALGFAQEKHAGQTRKGSNLPAVIHPLQMACYAVALGIKDDHVVATILLHDVCEDTGFSVSALPFSKDVVRGVRYMTFSMHPGEEKTDAKKRYFKELLESRAALICKAIDRYNNLSSMLGALDEEAIIKNIKETDELLLPVLKEAKEKWPELSNLLYILRENIRSVNDNLAFVYKVELDNS